jgi:hypothetical protein
LTRRRLSTRMPIELCCAQTPTGQARRSFAQANNESDEKANRDTATKDEARTRRRQCTRASPCYSKRCLRTRVAGNRNSEDDRRRIAALLTRGANHEQRANRSSIRHGASRRRNRIFLRHNIHNFVLRDVNRDTREASRRRFQRFARCESARHTPSFCLSMSLTTCGLAFPPVDFIT